MIDFVIAFAVLVAITGLVYVAAYHFGATEEGMNPKDLKALSDHHFEGEFRVIKHQLDRILCSQEKIMATQAELAKQLSDVNDKLVKVGTEIDGLSKTSAESLALIKTLQDTIANNPVDPTVKAAADAVAAKAQELDDKIPDSPVP